MRLSAIDKKILNRIQEDIPLVSQPFRALAKDIDISEEKLLQRIGELKNKGIIRDYTAGIDHRVLGFKSTLLGLKVPQDRIESLGKELETYSDITHCYQRKGRYNLWVVLIYKNGRLKKLLHKLNREIGKENILDLKTTRKFKLKTRIKL
jgi:DNA-binding Lrp family transcriptional regulator